MPNVSGQTNNPFNQFGADVIAATKVMHQDYLNGKLNEINQETLDQYFQNFFPNYPTVKLEDFNTILKVLKDASNTSIIKNSGYSDEAKAFLQKSLESYSITKLVDEVKNSKINKNEKEMSCLFWQSTTI